MKVVNYFYNYFATNSDFPNETKQSAITQTLQASITDNVTGEH